MSPLKALNSVLLYCQDIRRSAEFYERLGFSIGPEHDGVVLATVGAFTIHLLDQSKAVFQQDAPRDKGAGVFLRIEVSDIDQLHTEFLGKDLRPAGVPHDWPWGSREFAMKDPDGYRLVFWQLVKKSG